MIPRAYLSKGKRQLRGTENRKPDEDRKRKLVTNVTDVVHLHVHNEYSFLDGVGTSVHLAKRAREAGIPAVALTNHGNLSGVLHHIKACEAEGVRPILGMEAYFRVDRTRQDASNKKYFHLLLLAADAEGFRNLMRMSSESFASGFYHKPCVDEELLRKHGEGVIASTSCLSGYVPHAIMTGDSWSERHGWDFLQDTFRDRLFAEIQPHDFDLSRQVNVQIVNEANRRGVPIVATCDAHYPWKDWADTHDVLLMAQTGQTVVTRRKAKEEDEDFMQFSGDTFYLMTGEELVEEFRKSHPALPESTVIEAVNNTATVASWIEPFEIDKSMKVPKAGDDSLSVLRDWCEEGLVRVGKAGDSTYRQRMEHELGVLEKAGVVDYFVVIGKMVRRAKDKGIRVGPGRGSAAGSLVSYLSRITAIDPIGHGLLFERFLNPDRAEMPDIDIDFQHDRRGEVIEDLKAEYGEDHVANVAAFQTYAMASAIQAVGRVLDLPFDYVRNVTKTFEEDRERAGDPEDEGEMRLTQLVDVSSTLQEFRRDHPDAWRHATRIEGQVKTMGKHPAGVVITDRPLSDYMPTMRSSGGQHVTAWSERASFPIITEYGFLKIDALSTDGLTVQRMAADLIRERHGRIVDFEDPVQFPVIEDPRAVDQDVIAAFGTESNLGVFQFASRGISGLLKDIEPEWLGDVIAANALYRPGPLDGGVAFSYGKRKNGKEKWKHFHPVVASFLDETYGIIVYQEQVIEIVKAIGGLSPGDADFVRKSMTKWHSNKDNKRRGLSRMTQFYDKAREHAMTLGLTATEFDDVWDKVLQFSKYGFNKSHSASYALQAYQDKWLKARYPHETYTAMLTIEKGKVAKFVREAIARGVRILPPDINKSGVGFGLDGDAIRFGLDSIHDVGVVNVKEITSKQPFADFDDFKARITKQKCNSKAVTALIEAGAMDRWGKRDGLGPKERMDLERARLKHALTTEHAIEDAKLITERVYRPEEIDGLAPGSTLTVGGEVATVKKIKTKKGADMAFVELEHGAADYRVTVFPRQWNEAEGELVEGQRVLVSGKLDADGSTVLADQWTTVEKLKEALSERRRTDEARRTADEAAQVAPGQEAVPDEQAP